MRSVARAAAPALLHVSVSCAVFDAAPPRSRLVSRTSFRSACWRSAARRWRRPRLFARRPSLRPRGPAAPPSPRERQRPPCTTRSAHSLPCAGSLLSWPHLVAAATAAGDRRGESEGAGKLRESEGRARRGRRGRQAGQELNERSRRGASGPFLLCSGASLCVRSLDRPKDRSKAVASLRSKLVVRFTDSPGV